MNAQVVMEMLDRVASSLESKGLLKEATEVDVISNTIEKSSFRMPWKKEEPTEQSPQVKEDNPKIKSIIKEMVSFLEKIPGASEDEDAKWTINLVVYWVARLVGVDPSKSSSMLGLNLLSDRVSTFFRKGTHQELNQAYHVLSGPFTPYPMPQHSVSNIFNTLVIKGKSYVERLQDAVEEESQELKKSEQHAEQHAKQLSEKMKSKGLYN